MFIIRRILLVSMILVGLVDFILGMDYVGQARTDAVANAKEAWRHLTKEYMKGLTVEIQYYLVADSKDASKATVCMDEQNEYNLFSRQNYHDETIHVVNPRYSFNIRQEGDNVAWIMQEMSNSPAQERMKKDMHENVLWGTSLVSTSVMLEDAWLEDLVNSDSFEILSMRTHKIENDDNEYVELTFKSDFFSDAGATKVQGGRVLLIPNLYWVVKDCELDLESNLGKDGVVHATGKHSIDYQVIDGIPFPKKKEIIYKYKSDGKIINDMIIDYTSIKRGDIPKDILYLSHYGFSEPEDPNRRLNIVRIVLMTAGVLLILFGLYLRWFAKKK